MRLMFTGSTVHPLETSETVCKVKQNVVMYCFSVVFLSPSWQTLQKYLTVWKYTCLSYNFSQLSW